MHSGGHVGTSNRCTVDTNAPPQRSFPHLNEPAPKFEAPTTHGVKAPSDYAGRWIVPFSHPANFIPVCTTGFMAFANAYDELQVMNAELGGLSTDSHFSHVAGTRFGGSQPRLPPPERGCEEEDDGIDLETPEDHQHPKDPLPGGSHVCIG